MSKEAAFSFPQLVSHFPMRFLSKAFIEFLEPFSAVKPPIRIRERTQ
jgi:hypothetical protein